MTITQLIDLTGAKPLTQTAPLNREITTGYTCDLLSWVMAHGEAGMAWITVQTHLNVIAIATLMEMSCVIIPEGIAVDQAVIDKADEEGVALLSSDKTAYWLAGTLFAAGIAAS